MKKFVSTEIFRYFTLDKEEGMCKSLRRFVYMKISAGIRWSSDVRSIESSFDITYTQTMNKQSMKIELMRQYADTHLFTVRSKRLTTPPSAEAVSVIWVTEAIATRNKRQRYSNEKNSKLSKPTHTSMDNLKKKRTVYRKEKILRLKSTYQSLIHPKRLPRR